MIYQVIVEAQAADDITDYGRWILAQGAPLNALRWVEDIEEAIASLATMPERCPMAPEAESFGLAVREFLFKSHRVLFIVDGPKVHVLHVRHAARLPLDP